MQQSAHILSQLPLTEGYNKTPLQGVGIYKASQPIGRVPLCYAQGVIIILQGKKRIFFDNVVYDYNPDNYLVLTIPLAAECETLLDDNLPLLSLIIDFDMTVILELISQLDEHGQIDKQPVNANKGLFVSRCTEGMSCVIQRLATCLTSPLQCDVIGKGLLKEVFFHILSGPQAAPLVALASHSTLLSRIEHVLKHVHNNYQNTFDVDQLAGMVNMSSSTFHRNFKQITSLSPMQYIKKIRLNRARELLQDQGLKVKQVAQQVGYESAAQFSREFTRYYGKAPSALSA